MHCRWPGGSATNHSAPQRAPGAKAMRGRRSGSEVMAPRASTPTRARTAQRLDAVPSTARNAPFSWSLTSKTCRYCGITRQAYYKWLRRYEEGGLEALRDRSSRPHVSPKATRVEVVGKIIYLRQTYHFGPHKIAMYLKRYHDIELSPSGIWRILHRLDMSRLPSSQRYRRQRDRWKRYDRPEPAHVHRTRVTESRSS